MLEILKDIFSFFNMLRCRRNIKITVDKVFSFYTKQILKITIINKSIEPIIIESIEIDNGEITERFGEKYEIITENKTTVNGEVKSVSAWYTDQLPQTIGGSNFFCGLISNNEHKPIIQGKKCTLIAATSKGNVKQKLIVNQIYDDRKKLARAIQLSKPPTKEK